MGQTSSLTFTTSKGALTLGPLISYCYKARLHFPPAQVSLSTSDFDTHVITLIYGIQRA